MFRRVIDRGVWMIKGVIEKVEEDKINKMIWDQAEAVIKKYE